MTARDADSVEPARATRLASDRYAIWIVAACYWTATKFRCDRRPSRSYATSSLKATRWWVLSSSSLREGPVKLYDFAPAPNPRRVRIFLAEKGVSIPIEQINLREGLQFTPAFRAINPDCTVPVLELDDGTRLTEVAAICRYIEELHPEPPLMGLGAKEAAIVEACQRKIEFKGLLGAMDALRNSVPAFKGRALPGPDNYEQIPELAERGRARIQHFFAWLDQHLANSEFISGAKFTIADITAMVVVDFCGWVKLAPSEDQAHLRRWHAAVSARPSAKA